MVYKSNVVEHYILYYYEETKNLFSFFNKSINRKQYVFFFKKKPI